MDENEKLVRETWGGADRLPSSFWLSLIGETLSDCDNWKHAADFTRERLEEVRQVEEELDQVVMMHTVHVAHSIYEPIWDRIKSRLEAIRDDLKKGMKP